MKTDTDVQQIAIKLLQGDFICKFTHPEHFKQLQNEERVRTLVENCLETLGRHLTQNSNETTYFAVHDRDTMNYKEESERQFNVIRQKIRPTIGFLNTMASATAKQGETKVFMQGGQIIKIADVISGLTHNTAYTDTLTKLEWVKNKEAPLTDKVKTLFKEAEKEGLIQLIDKVAERYIVTGKLDVMVDMMLFIADSENIMSTENATSSTNSDRQQVCLDL
jgi:hypothetical protein